MVNPDQVREQSDSDRRGVNSERLAAYVAEGLIPESFKPQGETERGRRVSIESKAYGTWVRNNARDLGCLHPDEVSNRFARRHDNAGQEADQGQHPAVPHGDAWEQD